MSEIRDAVDAFETAKHEEAQRAARAAAYDPSPDDFKEAARALSIRVDEIAAVDFVENHGVVITTADGVKYILLLPGETDAAGQTGLLVLSGPKYPIGMPRYQGDFARRYDLQVALRQGGAA